jgi:hypothetical protein
MADYLTGRAAEYFPDFSGARTVVRLRDGAEREKSAVYVFDLRGYGRQRSVIVKRCGKTTGQRQDAPAGDRPTIGAWTPPEKLWQFEGATLSAIQEHFDAVGNPQFGAVRLLDVLPDYGAIVMDRLECPTLRTLLMQTGWRRGSHASAELGAALRNTGAWLRAFQQIPPLEHTRPRFTRRTELVDCIGEFADVLEQAGTGRLVRSIVSKTQTVARSILPEELPTGLGHGDFAPRNVLVGSDDRVFVIDTVGKWSWPVYQDLAYFLTAMKTVGLQIFSNGLLFTDATMAAFEAEFLRGYYAEETPPLAVIRLFEIQCLLARWCSAVDRHARASGAKKLAGRLDLRIRSRFYGRALERAVADLDRALPPPPY